MRTGVIYALIDPFEGIRYVGRTIAKPSERLRDHIKNARNHTENNYKARWIRKLLQIGHAPTIEILESNIPEDQIASHEINWIAAFRACPYFRLTNLTDGGEGALNPSPEVGQYRRERMKGNTIWLGRKATDEHRQRISAALTGRPKSLEYIKKTGRAIMDQFGTVYPGIGYAARTLNLPRASIQRVLRGKYKQAGGYVFSYVTPEGRS